MVTLRINSPLLADFIREKAGEEGYNVVRVLSACSRGCTDEELSAETGIKVNVLRATLNRLHYSGIIRYSKEKAQTSNWYTYTWFLEKSRIIELLKERYEEELSSLKEKLKYEQDYVFFKCKNGCERLPFELALEYDFKCPQCGAVMLQEDNKAEIKSIKQRIKEIESFLKEISGKRNKRVKKAV
ncbi:hypothetical protein DRN74_01355 [Candidatus Micrarchaeota archaeon]|nr:MAG: hypothetical protein DRN74_01355 [Candidatus Micrarchaeota archaeon]